MALIPTILWWLAFPFVLNLFKRKTFSILSIFIFLVISGRIPFPINYNIEAWMIYGVVFAPLCLTKWLRLGKFSFINLLPFLGILFTAIFSSIILGSYNDGYLLLSIELVFMVIYILNRNIASKAELYTEIKESFLISVILITLLALFAQVLITMNIASCANFWIYHPWGDIHCVPIGISTIYRLSIGSNINEFSFYLSLAIILLVSSGKNQFEKNHFLTIYRLPIMCILGLSGLLSLSRALYLSCILSMIFIFFKDSVVTAAIIFKKFLLSKKTVFIYSRIFVIILIVSIFSRMVLSNVMDSSDLQNLGDRFSFLFNISKITEGVSSQDRLSSLDSISNKVEELAIFPTLKLGEATFVHNTFLQCLLEYGFLNASLGIVSILSVMRKNIYLAIALIVYMGVHHILYNPILYLGWYIVSNAKSSVLSNKTC